MIELKDNEFIKIQVDCFGDATVTFVEVGKVITKDSPKHLMPLVHKTPDCYYSKYLKFWEWDLITESPDKILEVWDLIIHDLVYMVGLHKKLRKVEQR